MRYLKIILTLLIIGCSISYGQTTLNICTGVNVPVGAVAFNVVSSSGPLACLIFPATFAPLISGSVITLSGGGGGGGGGSSIWGQITGTLSSQTDLQTALTNLQVSIDTKQNILQLSGNTNKVTTAAGSFIPGDFAKFDSNSNLIDAGISSFSAIWSNIQNPAGALSLTMLHNPTTLTYDGTTGSSDLFKLTDGVSNTGTGILLHATTKSGSMETPFQADTNGVGYKLAADGSLTAVGGSSHYIASGTNGNSDLNGKLVLSGGAGTYTFSATYAIAPVCIVEDETTRTNTLVKAVTTTTLSISGGTGSDTVAYICMGRN